MANWLIPITEKNWEAIKRENVYGAPEGSAAQKLIKSGDNLVFYITKKGSKRLGGRVVGVYRVTSEWFREDKPLWPDEVSENRVKYPWRTKIESIKLGVADFRELVERLSITKSRKAPQAVLIGTPANGRKPIPEEDLRIILESLKPYSV